MFVDGAVVLTAVGALKMVGKIVGIEVLLVRVTAVEGASVPFKIGVNTTLGSMD